ncbi:MAG: patatin-like phospholipase family protein [Anaerolineales bacterium]
MNSTSHTSPDGNHPNQSQGKPIAKDQPGPDKLKLAIVIGSGSAMCAASLGMWKVFRREGIEISLAVGCSGGSLYAAAIALGYEFEAVEEMSRRMWSSDLVEGYIPNLRAAMSGEKRFTEKSGLVDDQNLLEVLQTIFGERKFSETQIPLYIVSTDLYSGESVLHESGRILDAVRASAAIPMIFAPWQVEGRWLVDGAVSNPLPIDVAIREGAGLIAAMGFELPTRSRMRSYTAVTSHFNSIYMNNILKSRFAFYNAVHHAEIIPILPDFDRPVGGFDGYQVPYLIEKGAQATEERLPYIRRLLASGEANVP